VKSLAHPGGNITGMANMFGELSDKSVGLLNALAPSAKKMAVLMSTNPTHGAIYEAIRSSARQIGLQAVPILAKTSDDLEDAFQEMSRAGCDILFVIADPIRPKIVDLAARGQIPALYQFAEYVAMGGLVSYGPSLPELYGRSARYVDAIFKGADPANLPVAQPTVFELVVNLKTARQLGLLIPDSIMVRADRVIE
jgi:putative ABC transport system substrate-binding protein